MRISKINEDYRVSMKSASIAAAAVQETENKNEAEAREKTLKGEMIADAFGNKTAEDYKDPLRNWPIKLCAYSNEAGEAIRGVAPKLGTLMWAPALMYIGADVYDKYKNNKTEYNPSKERGLKEAIFQGLASVFLPTAAVAAGQRAASSLNRYTKRGLSSQAAEDIINTSLEFMKSADMKEYEKNPQAYKEAFVNAVMQQTESAQSGYRAMSMFKKALSWINPLKDSDNLAHADRAKVKNFAEQQGSLIMDMYSSLVKGEKPQAKEMSGKLFAKFQSSKSSFNSIAEAAKASLQDVHASQLFKNKLLKTAGGFIALGLAIKPIDKFVENVIIKKAVEPALDYAAKRYYPADTMEEFGQIIAQKNIERRVQENAEDVIDAVIIEETENNNAA